MELEAIRTASAPLPAGAVLVIGDPDRARVALVRRTFPTLVRLGLAAGALIFGAAVAIAASG